MLTEFCQWNILERQKVGNIEMELKKVAVGMTICCWVRVMSSSKLFI
jgi:hypothetical protein